MKKNIYALLLTAILLLPVFAYGQNFECSEWESRDRVKQRYGQWISTRDNSENNITRLNGINGDTSKINAFRRKYNQHVLNLNSLLETVKQKISSGKMQDVLNFARGNRLVDSYQYRVESDIKGLQDLNLQMAAYYKSVTGETIAGGGLPDDWREIIGAIIQIVFEEGRREIIKRELKKVNCLRYKMWDEI